MIKICICIDIPTNDIGSISISYICWSKNIISLTTLFKVLTFPNWDDNGIMEGLVGLIPLWLLLVDADVDRRRVVVRATLYVDVSPKFNEVGTHQSTTLPVTPRTFFTSLSVSWSVRDTVWDAAALASMLLVTLAVVWVVFLTARMMMSLMEGTMQRSMEVRMKDRVGDRAYFFLLRRLYCFYETRRLQTMATMVLRWFPRPLQCQAVFWQTRATFERMS